MVELGRPKCVERTLGLGEFGGGAGRLAIEVGDGPVRQPFDPVGFRDGLAGLLDRRGQPLQLVDCGGDPARSDGWPVRAVSRLLILADVSVTSTSLTVWAFAAVARRVCARSSAFSALVTAASSALGIVSGGGRVSTCCAQTGHSSAVHQVRSELCRCPGRAGMLERGLRRRQSLAAGRHLGGGRLHCGPGRRLIDPQRRRVVRQGGPARRGRSTPVAAGPGRVRLPDSVWPVVRRPRPAPGSTLLWPRPCGRRRIRSPRSAIPSGTLISLSCRCRSRSCSPGRSDLIVGVFRSIPNLPSLGDGGFVRVDQRLGSGLVTPVPGERRWPRRAGERTAGHAPDAGR